MRRKNNNALDAIKRRPRRWLVFFRSSVSSSSIFFIRSSSSFSPFFKSLSPRTTLPPCGLLTSPVGFHWKTFSFEYGVWFGSIRFSLWFLSDSPGYRFQWNFSIARFTWHSTTDGVLPSFAKLYWVERGFSCFFYWIPPDFIAFRSSRAEHPWRPCRGAVCSPRPCHTAADERRNDRILHRLRCVKAAENVLRVEIWCVAISKTKQKKQSKTKPNWTAHVGVTDRELGSHQPHYLGRIFFFILRWTCKDD